MKVRLPLSHLVALSLVFTPSRSLAETSGEARRGLAEALFLEGRRLVAAGKTAEGCAKFAESQAIDPGVGTLLNLARCYERIGRTASAWTTYREAAARAKTAGQPEREAAARAEAQRLADIIPIIEIRSPAENSTKGLTVTFDGEAWSNALLNVELPVDPGPHEIAVTAPGFQRFSTRFEAVSGRLTFVPVPALEPLSKARAGTPPDPVEPWRTTHTFAVANAALALTAATLGSVFAVKASNTYDSAEAYCTGDYCEPRGLVLREEAIDQADLATVAFGVAGAALVSAAILWFTRRAPDRLPWQATTNSVSVGRVPQLQVKW